MKAWRKRAAEFVGVAVALVLAAGVIVPYLGANRYAERIRAGLEGALGRHIEFGDVHLTLLTGPGVTVSKVVIEEDPAFGAEPVAYVESLQARPRLLPLLVGRLEFASLVLEDTSVNLTRLESGSDTAWNFTKLLHRTIF